MPESDDVVAALDLALRQRKRSVEYDGTVEGLRNLVLAALTAEGIACLYVPEGVAVAHGARLVSMGVHDTFGRLFAIEDTP